MTGPARGLVERAVTHREDGPPQEGQDGEDSHHRGAAHSSPGNAPERGAWLPVLRERRDDLGANHNAGHNTGQG